MKASSSFFFFFFFFFFFLICSFRPDEDQGNPGRNVVSDRKCAGAEGEEVVFYICLSAADRAWPSGPRGLSKVHKFLSLLICIFSNCPQHLFFHIHKMMIIGPSCTHTPVTLALVTHASTHDPL